MSLRRGVVIPPHAASVVLRNALSHLGSLIIASATALDEKGGGESVSTILYNITVGNC